MIAACLQGSGFSGLGAGGLGVGRSGWDGDVTRIEVANRQAKPVLRVSGLWMLCEAFPWFVGLRTCVHT